MPELRRSASAPDLTRTKPDSQNHQEIASSTDQREVDWLRQTKGKQPVAHGDKIASSSTTDQREVASSSTRGQGKEFNVLRDTSIKTDPRGHRELPSSSTRGQGKEFNLLKALEEEERRRWGDQGTMSRDVSPRGDQGTMSQEPDSHIDIEMSSMARPSPGSRGRRHSSNARHHPERRRPRDLEEGFGPHEGNEGHHTDTDRSRSVSSERSEGQHELTASELRSILGNISQRLDNLQNSLRGNTGNNTGRRTWGEWYDGRWNSHISTIGGVVAPLSVVGTVYLLRPDLLTKAVNGLISR